LIQVGVDVPRLGLMIMLGQPKGTAEYIQASSRVGRTAQSSGLVFTLFQHTRPRDRSHYEDFKGYHSALYRAVEPISVTPLAEPALERSIRAVFASIARHAVNTNNDADAKTVGSNNELLKEAAQLIRAAAKDRDDGMASAASLDRILDQMQESWHARAVSGKALMWSNESKQLGQFPMLLAPRLPPSDGPEWPYDYSMRNVEASVNVPLVSMTRMGREGADE
jgi:alkanesulfonate monooxygenase SsuD/methylene tetrahydromethanopterin reductase-like flavin-dependent oxidoreductase (luciferase family)